jgi:uncharacterized membrane protein
VTVTLGLMVADLAVLIYFIHHTAVSIQLPQVIAGIAAGGRQSSLGMPAVMIRLLEALARIMAETTSEGQRRVLLEQAAMINRACERSVPEAGDRADIQRRYEAI